MFKGDVVQTACVLFFSPFSSFFLLPPRPLLNAAIPQPSTPPPPVKGSDYLGMDTRYNYTLDITADGKHAVARAASIYGAMYAMESFVQLIDLKSGQLLASEVAIVDAPQYSWRGLMIDAGRRFFPVPLVKNLMDTMAGAKLNVLHLHASDMCRFGVESKLYPNLTNALTGIHGGFYTQADVADLIAYGGSRAIRVVPEFDFPGHSRGQCLTTLSHPSFAPRICSRTTDGLLRPLLPPFSAVACSARSRSFC